MPHPRKCFCMEITRFGGTFKQVNRFIKRHRRKRIRGAEMGRYYRQWERLTEENEI